MIIKFLFLKILMLMIASSNVFISRVIDGDTLQDSRGNRIRLLGVDCPEMPNQCYARESKEYTINKVERELVFLTYEDNKIQLDPYGRILAWVYYRNSTKLLNKDLIRDGYGISYRKYPTSKLTELNMVEIEAKNKNLGIWRYCK